MSEFTYQLALIRGAPVNKRHPVYTPEGYKRVCLIYFFWKFEIANSGSQNSSSIFTFRCSLSTSVTSLHISTIWPFRPQKPNIFWKLIIHHYLLVTQIQIHKYANTQIQLRSKMQTDTTCAIFLKRWWYEDLKDKLSSCLTCKRKYKNTQIHKHTNTGCFFSLVLP